MSTAGRRHPADPATAASRPVAGPRRAARRSLAQLACGVLLLIAIIAGPDLYGRVTGGDRLDPRLAGTRGVAHVEVTMGFAPQGFHLRTLQRLGVFGGKVGERGVRLFNVRPAGLDRLRRLYWVESIRPIAR